MKAVVFDFDGTLTIKKGNLWKKIWSELGYDIGEDSYYVSLYKSFLKGDITHKQWCELTLDAFKARGLNQSKFYQIADTMKLGAGASELLESLYKKGIEIHIISGNITSVIERTLGNDRKYVSCIKANQFVFDQNGDIVEIVGTKYDHQGKATYITELCESKGFKPSEVLFIGNSMNDEWVYKAGARTLCVNPDQAKSDDLEIWNRVVYTDNLLSLEREILEK